MEDNRTYPQHLNGLSFISSNQTTQKCHLIFSGTKFEVVRIVNAKHGRQKVKSYCNCNLSLQLTDIYNLITMFSFYVEKWTGKSQQYQISKIKTNDEFLRNLL